MGHEGRRARQGPVNVAFSAFHEGRGAGKTDPPGGHDLVSRKKIVNRKEKLQEKRMLDLDRKQIGSIPEMLGRIVRSKRFALAAFLIPVFIRSIPEILVGPYPIGWDTIAFYVPNTLDWATGKTGFTEILGTAPLMYMISVPVYWVSRVNPVWIFKIMGPILYGSMIWALFRFLKTGLKWPSKQALGGALLTSLYFVTLRISWDLYRNMLGLTFILLSLPSLGNLETRKKQALFSVFVVLAVASDQLTAVLALVLVGVRALTELAEGMRANFVKIARAGLPGFGLFFSILYANFLISGQGPIQQQPPTPGLDTLALSVGFLGYAFLIILPLAAIGFRRTCNTELSSWWIFCLAASLTALLPFFGFIVASYRWTLLMDIPLCIYTAAGIAHLARVTTQINRFAKLSLGRIFPIIGVILVTLSALYVALPAQRAMAYYSVFPSLVPTSMVQDSVSMSDMPSVSAMLNWVAINSGPNTALITHQAIYGWARAYLPTTSHIVNYAYSTPLDGVRMARSAGYSTIFMIWWVNGTGWHDQPYVPGSFVTVVRDGSFEVYSYD